MNAVGFDLDMTLVDSRPCSERALRTMVAEHCPELDVDALIRSYGLPLAQWLPAGTDHRLFRELQREALGAAKLMPGAGEAVDAARSLGARVVVVTAAPTGVAEAMLRGLAIQVDAVHADLWATGKAMPLRSEDCGVFVGDHADDMRAAKEAGAVALGVASGTTTPTGAEVLLDDLNHFPSWLNHYVGG